MKVHIDTERKHACVVSSSDIKKLWKCLEEHVGKVTARIKCSNDETRKYGDLEKLTSYDNPSTKQIVSLDIESRSDDWKKSVDIQFSDNEFSIISIDIEAREQTASEIRERMSDILDGTKPWYSRLAFVHHSSLGGTVILLLAAFISGIAAAHIYEDFPDFESIYLGHAVFTGEHLFFIIAGLLWIPIGLGWLRPRLLPACCFALGQGEHRYRRLVNIHRAILALIIALVVGAVY